MHAKAYSLIPTPTPCSISLVPVGSCGAVASTVATSRLPPSHHQPPTSG